MATVNHYYILREDGGRILTEAGNYLVLEHAVVQPTPTPGERIDHKLVAPRELGVPAETRVVIVPHSDRTG